MKRLLLAAVLFFAPAAGAHAAAPVRMVIRDVLPPPARSLAAVSRFNLVGLHWQGAGSVEFRTLSLAGRWSAWEPAAPEAEDLPDGPPGSWRLGSPFWTGPSDRIEYRVHGRVRPNERPTTNATVSQLHVTKNASSTNEAPSA